MADPVVVEQEGTVAFVRLNRPEAYNAMNLDLMTALSDHCLALAADDAVRALVLVGQGKAFCAGGDLKWVLGYPGGPSAAFHILAARLHQAILEIRHMPKPVIAAVNGVAAGAGFSLAIACDFRVMAESATLRQAYTSSGLCIDGGGTFSLPRLVGHARSLEIAAFDEPISSTRAAEWGLATKVVPDGTVLETAAAMARDLATRSLHSFARSKALLLESFDTPLERQLERERAGLCACGRHPDGQEGLKAFAAKRKPVFHRG